MNQLEVCLHSGCTVYPPQPISQTLFQIFLSLTSSHHTLSLTTSHYTLSSLPTSSHPTLCTMHTMQPEAIWRIVVRWPQRCVVCEMWAVCVCSWWGEGCVWGVWTVDSAWVEVYGVVCKMWGGDVCSRCGCESCGLWILQKLLDLKLGVYCTTHGWSFLISHFLVPTFSGTPVWWTSVVHHPWMAF